VSSKHHHVSQIKKKYNNPLGPGNEQYKRLKQASGFAAPIVYHRLKYSFRIKTYEHAINYAFSHTHFNALTLSNIT